MTSKDFKHIAVVVKNEVNHGTDPAVIARVAQGLADVCLNANERFDRDKFYVACGIR